MTVQAEVDFSFLVVHDRILFLLQEDLIVFIESPSCSAIEVIGTSASHMEQITCFCSLVIAYLLADVASHIKIEGQRIIPAPHADYAFTSVPL